MQQSVRFLTALAATFLASSPLVAGDLTFSRAPSFDERVTIVEVGSTLNDASDWDYWFKRTIRRGKLDEVWWTDTTHCPAARWVVENAINLTPPVIEVPGIKGKDQGDDIVVTADGALYELTSGARYGENIGSQISFSSNVGTTLANWADESLRRLDPCWSKERSSLVPKGEY